MEPFRIRNVHKLRSLTLAIELMGARPSPADEAMDSCRRTAIADAWIVLSWASGPRGRHEDAIAEGVAVVTDELDAGEWRRTLGASPRLRDGAPGVWPAVMSSLEHGPFGGPSPMMAHVAPEGALRLPEAVVHYPGARRGRLPHASLPGALRHGLDGAPPEVRSARDRLSAAVTTGLDLALAAAEADYASLPDLAAEIDRCVTDRDLLDLFPQAARVLGAAGPTPANAAAAAILRGLA